MATTESAAPVKIQLASNDQKLLEVGKLLTLPIPSSVYVLSPQSQWSSIMDC